MDNLYDQLYRLTRLPNAYDEWTEYRSALTDFLISTTPEAGSALIVGAGESNDLDLARLAVHFSSVTLLDCDMESMRRALLRYGNKENTIRCAYADLVGISPERYRKTADRILGELRSGKPADAVEQLFLSEIEEGYRTRRPSDLPEPLRWDTVVCCGVHSQLLCMYMRMAAVYARYIGLDLGKIERKLRELNRDLIPLVNRRLIEAAGRRLVIGAETERIGERGGVEGALQALSDPQLEKLPLLGSTALVWDLERFQEKRYRMEIRTYRTDGIPQ